MIDLSGRVVIVTGGNSGIGPGIACGVARADASVAIWSRRAERNAEAVAELEGLGATTIGLQCDVGDEDTVPAPCGRRSAGSAAWIARSPAPDGRQAVVHGHVAG